MKPVYVINGFLESGKTEFIAYTLEQPYFQVKGKTLLILCEEGESEYGETLLKVSRTEILFPVPVLLIVFGFPLPCKRQVSPFPNW